MPREQTLTEFESFDTIVGQLLNLDGARLTPNLLSNVLLPVIQAFGTQPFRENMKFESVVGAADDIDVEVADQCPDGKTRYVLYAEVSHNGADHAHQPLVPHAARFGHRLRFHAVGEGQGPSLRGT